MNVSIAARMAEKYCDGFTDATKYIQFIIDYGVTVPCGVYLIKERVDT